MGAPAALADGRPSLGSWSLMRDHLMEVCWLVRKLVLQCLLHTGPRTVEEVRDE